MSDFTIKDSGSRQEFDSGMVRDVQEGKTLWRLVRSGPMLRRWAEHLTRGALKYSRDNWLLAEGETELERFKDSAARHFEQWLAGERDEDHAAAVFFNINGAEYVQDKLGGSLDSTEAQAPDAGSTPAPSTDQRGAEYLGMWGGIPVFKDPAVSVSQPRLVTVGEEGTTYEPLHPLRQEQWGGVPVEVIDITEEK